MFFLINFKYLARELLNVRNNWFIIGLPRFKIPKWAGYALGFELVKNYLKNNPAQSAASLVSAPVEKLKIF